jgi:hypothetical protein
MRINLPVSIAVFLPQIFIKYFKSNFFITPALLGGQDCVAHCQFFRDIWISTMEELGDQNKVAFTSLVNEYHMFKRNSVCVRVEGGCFTPPPLFQLILEIIRKDDFTLVSKFLQDSCCSKQAR